MKRIFQSFRFSTVFTIGLTILFIQCKNPRITENESLIAATTNLHQNFIEVASESGIDHSYSYPKGAGVAVIDYNNDFLEDLLFAHPTKNKLYRNNGDGTFSEIAEHANIIQPEGIKCIGVVSADFNNDGYEDIIFVTDRGDPLLLYINQGNGTFNDISAKSGLNYTEQILKRQSVSVGDVNLDGYLDIYVTNHVKSRVFNKEKSVSKDPHKDQIRFCFQDQLFINNGKLFFEEKSTEYNVINLGCGFSPVFTDPDNDGDQDILVVNDWGIESVPSRYFRNEYPLKTFTDFSQDSGFDQGVWGMGMAVGDYDQDGDLDYYETNIGSNKFFENDGNGVFLECAKEKGVSSKWMNKAGKDYILAGWGTSFLDFDNNTWLDLFVTNGKLRSFDAFHSDYFGGKLLDSMPSKLFKNTGNGYFEDVTTQMGVNETNNTKSVVFFDFENDGDLDVLLAGTKLLPTKKEKKGIAKKQFLSENKEGKPNLLQNNVVTNNNWLRVKLVGTEINRNAIGSHLTIYLKDRSWLHEINSAASGNLSQSSRIAHFGLESFTTVDSLVIDWLGPENENTVLFNIPANQLIVVTQGEKNYETITCFNGIKDGDETDVDCGGSCKVCDCSQVYQDTCFNKDICFYASLCSQEVNIDEKSIARKWNEVLLNAIRSDFARPTVHSRNLFHFSVAMYDIWALFDQKAMPYLIGNKMHGYQSNFSGLPNYKNSEQARETAMSYAAFRLLNHRFKHSPGAYQSRKDMAGLMTYLGHDKENESLDYSSGDPAALGNYIASELIKYGLQDGSNETNKYENRYYKSTNANLRMDHPGNPHLRYKNRWQPLTLETFVDQSGNEIPNNTPDFLSAEWGNVSPFSLNKNDLTVYNRDGHTYKVYCDPKETPPHFDTKATIEDSDYKWGFLLVPIWASHLSAEDTTLFDISPANIGNIPTLPKNHAEMRGFYDFFQGGDASEGHKTNPYTGKPYEHQWVKRSDYARVLAEFWADGPDSETPPGHWFTLLNHVSDHPESQKKFQGKGERMNELEWDVKAYFLLSGALHDAAISAWGIKGWYDYIRPVSAFRYMASKGQCTDSNLPNYTKEGIPLMKGYIEMIKAGDPNFKDSDVGKIKVYSWRGPKYIKYSTTDEAGVGWILAENWWPYQRPSFVTPPFSGYVSGHSTFSRAAAEVLTLLTGSEFFPGGMAEFEIKKDEFLVFENGPSEDFKLQWATYRDASDQCSLSRIWGGIHPPADDIPGRRIGIKIGKKAFHHGISYFTSEPGL